MINIFYNIVNKKYFYNYFYILYFNAIFLFYIFYFFYFLFQIFRGKMLNKKNSSPSKLYSLLHLLAFIKLHALMGESTHPKIKSQIFSKIFFKYFKISWQKKVLHMQMWIFYSFLELVCNIK